MRPIHPEWMVQPLAFPDHLGLGFLKLLPLAPFGPHLVQPQAHHQRVVGLGLDGPHRERMIAQMLCVDEGQRRELRAIQQ